MRKPTFCICEKKKAQISFAFPASNHLLCLYSSVCVGPVRTQHWFLYDAVHFYLADIEGYIKTVAEVESQLTAAMSGITKVCIGSP